MTNQNIHMTHLEDLLLETNINGSQKLINLLSTFYVLSEGGIDSEYSFSIKADGSPAVVAGWNKNRFFVATKSIFNKTPKLFYDIDEIHVSSWDLQQKLIAAYENMKYVIPEGEIWQFDLLYTKDDVSINKVEASFHPNTIVYATPNGTRDYMLISLSNIGIALHTKYTGAIDNLIPEYSNEFKSTKLSVWSMPLAINPVNIDLKEHYNTIGGIITSTYHLKLFLEMLDMYPKIKSLIPIYQNSIIRSGSNDSCSVDGLIELIKSRYETKINSLKTDKGKNRVREELSDIMEFFTVDNSNNMNVLFQLMEDVVAVKMIIINKLSNLTEISTFLHHKDDGYIATGHEGFVAIENQTNTAIKLVDRTTFSHANFSDDFVKGWESKTSR